MDGSTAVETLNKTIFRPGWTITAASYYGDMIMVSIDIDTVDTSYPDPDGKFRTPKKLPVDEILDVGTVQSTEQLFYLILKWVQEFDQHENREFLQLRQPDGSFIAPLHPHTTEGNAAWDELERTKLVAF